MRLPGRFFRKARLLPRTVMLCALLLPATAQAADAVCGRIHGYWQPVYDATAERFPAMRRILELEKREFAEALLAAVRIRFDCDRMAHQTSQGDVRYTPMFFRITSHTQNGMVVEAPSGSSRRMRLEFEGELLVLESDNDCYVLQKAGPYDRQKHMERYSGE